MCPKFCTDAKPYKHTQTLTLRKARGTVRFWEGWWSDNPSGSRPNFFGRQHLTFNKGGKCGGAKQGIVRFWKVMRGEGLLCNPSGSRPNFFGRQHLTFNKGGKFSTGRGDGCAFEKVVEMERAVQREGQARQGCLK